MSERFYVNCPLGRGPAALQGAEAHHLTTVRRFRPSDEVCLFNGDGHEYRARVTAIDRRRVELEILDDAIVDRELPFRLIVACPLPKGNRGQFLVEKLTELGVADYVPLRTERSVVHPGENRRGKLERYVIEASKQCGRNVLMRIEELTPWEKFARREDLPHCKVMAHFEEDPLPQTGCAEDTVLAIGPEGGFTREEIELARQSGWRLTGLGPRTLRVETAAIALAARFALADLQSQASPNHPG